MQKKVLMVDLDPQANATFQSGINDADLTTYDLLTGKAKVNDVIVNCGKYDILPSDILLSGADQELSSIGREFLLKKALAPVMSVYDYIIIDTPPSLGVLSWNALAVANHVLIPVEPGYFALKGMIQLYDMIDKIRETFNPGLKIAGILLVRYQRNTKIGRDVLKILQELCEIMQTQIFDAKIREAVAVKEAQKNQKSIFEHATNAHVCGDYMAFVNELLRRVK